MFHLQIYKFTNLQMYTGPSKVLRAVFVLLLCIKSYYQSMCNKFLQKPTLGKSVGEPVLTCQGPTSPLWLISSYNSSVLSTLKERHCRGKIWTLQRWAVCVLFHVSEQHPNIPTMARQQILVATLNILKLSRSFFREPVSRHFFVGNNYMQRKQW